MDDMIRKSMLRAIAHMSDRQLAEYEQAMAKSVEEGPQHEVEVAYEIIDLVHEEQDRRKHDHEDPSSGLVDYDQQDRLAAESERIADHPFSRENIERESGWRPRGTDMEGRMPY
jgi:hypothetical protein